MMQLEPGHRPSVSEILSHPWMTDGDCPTQMAVVQEFLQRQKDVDAGVEDERQEKADEKAKHAAQRKNKATVRAGGAQLDEAEEAKAMEPSKTLEQYEKVFSQATQYFSSWNPDDIEAVLMAYLKENESLYGKDGDNKVIEPKVHDSKYKIKFTLANPT